MLALIQQKVKQYELTEYTDIKTWNRLGVRLGTITVLHPYEYARVLMQIGYEPIAPLPGRTLLGTPTLYLPNMFQYVAHIRGVDGFFGCFRGLSCKILGDLLSTHFSGKIVDRLEITGSTIYKPVQRKFHGFIDELDEDLETNHVQFKKNLKRNLAIQAVCVIISHPFELIAVRMMAEFVGQDQLYSSLWQSIGEIWTQNGLSGFYSGVVPRLLCELGCLVMSSSVTYLAFRYALRKRQERACFSAFSKLLASSIHYPYKVVSTRMIVSGSRLKAASLIHGKPYRGWWDCYAKLLATGQHKTGKWWFFRRDTRPSVPEEQFEPQLSSNSAMEQLEQQLDIELKHFSEKFAKSALQTRIATNPFIKIDRGLEMAVEQAIDITPSVEIKPSANPEQLNRIKSMVANLLRGPFNAIINLVSFIWNKIMEFVSNKAPLEPVEQAVGFEPSVKINQPINLEQLNRIKSTVVSETNQLYDKLASQPATISSVSKAIVDFLIGILRAPFDVFLNLALFIWSKIMALLVAIGETPLNVPIAICNRIVRAVREVTGGSN